MALAVVLVAIALVTLAVGFLGIARIAKDRTLLKSYEDVAKPSAEATENMRLAHARTRLKTELETDSDTHFAESHVRARVGEERQDADTWLPMRVLQQIGRALIQLTGIPLLIGKTADPTTMGNTAKPTLAVEATTNTAEVDILRDAKSTDTTTTTTTEIHWYSGNSVDESSYEDESDSENDITSRSMGGFVMDGMNFYATVAQLSFATAQNALDIGLFRASTIILHERRKELEDASIHAIGEQYPDIMCLPAHANARYAGPLAKKQSASLDSSDGVSPARVSSPTARAQRESSFLKAA